MARVRRVERHRRSRAAAARSVLDAVREDAEHLGRQRVLGDAKLVIQPGLRAPADVEGGKDVVWRQSMMACSSSQ
jgi:hypothetical protein